jgi:translation initiation factor 1
MSKSLKEQLLQKFSETVVVTDKNDEQLALAKKAGIIPSEHKLKIRVEKNKRGGKIVTVVDKLPPNREYFEKILKELKSKCGSGGTLKDDSLEIQGNHLDTVSEYLKSRGFKL